MVNEFSITSTSSEQTAILGTQIGSHSFPGLFIALYGELGAGKTCFTAGVASGLSITDTVSSPSYVIISEYEGEIPLYHIDLYRVGGRDEIEDLGYEEYFYGEGVTVVEWAERAAELLPPERIDVSIKFSGRDERTLHFRFIGESYRALFDSLTRAMKG